MKQEEGVGLVEIVIAVGVIAATFFAIAQVGILAMNGARDRNEKVRALAFAQEGIEAVRTIRDATWSGNIATLSFGSTYYATTSSDHWILTASNPGLLDGTFTRTVVVDNVARDINDDIVVVGGTDDLGTKKVTVTVSWGSPQKSVQLLAYLTNILKN
ncbi:MAG: hypothetical protein AAB581_04095 [Patescibacteria group bacterium]